MTYNEEFKLIWSKFGLTFDAIGALDYTYFNHYGTSGGGTCPYVFISEAHLLAIRMGWCEPVDSAQVVYEPATLAYFSTISFEYASAN